MLKQDLNTQKLNQIIKQNRLMDFEPVKLVNSVKKLSYLRKLSIADNKLNTQPSPQTARIS